MVQSASPNLLYVNPNVGNDNGAGTQANPFRTLTQALRRAAPATTIYLSAGAYSAASGEVFPLLVPSGVRVIGNESNTGNGVVIEGSGLYNSPTFGNQNVTVRLENGSQLRGVTVINRAVNGTGVWIESTSPTIANSTFINCGREGIFATGNAIPTVAGNLFQRNAASGVSFVRNAKGEIRRNRFQQTGYGIAIGNDAAPLVIENQLHDNRCGIALTGSARPVLRQNVVERNTSSGVLIDNSALPDLGKSQDPGGNVFRDNREFDLRNTTTGVVVSVGNLLNPVRVQGKVDFAASQSVASIANPVVSPTPAPAPVPTPAPMPVPISRPGQFPDIRGYWAEPFIQALVDRNIITGFPDGTFKPTLKITRAQYAVLVSKAFDMPLQRNATNFLDVAANYWAANAIAKAGQMGFISGFPDRTFRPNQNLTRIQAIVSLVSGLQLPAGQPSVLTLYRDRAQVPSYAIGAVAIATQRRIIVNHPALDQLKPLVDITRAEVAAILYQALVALGQAPAIPSPFIVVPDLSVPSFADVQGHWAENFIRGLASQGLISGFADGTFKPEAAMSRAQFAALLAPALKPAPKQVGTRFIDVPPDFWAANAIQQVYRAGILTDTGNSTFSPNQTVTRLQVVTALVNSLSLPRGDLGALTIYQDANTIPPDARSAIATATTHQLIVNYPQPHQLQPNQTATRAEVAAMLYQALVKTARTPAIASPYVVGSGE